MDAPEQRFQRLVLAAAVDMLLSNTDGQADAAEIAFRGDGKRSGFWAAAVDAAELVFEEIGDQWDELLEVDVAEMIAKVTRDRNLHPVVEKPISQYVDRLFWPADDTDSVRL